MKPRDLQNNELLRQFLKFAREHFSKHSSEIIISDTSNAPSFIVTPYKRNQNEN